MTIRRTILMLAAAAAIGTLAGCNAQAQSPPPLPREFASLYDCRGEAALIAYYWDRLPQRPGGGKPDPAVLQPLWAAHQRGDLEACHREVIAVRRYLGLL